MGTEILSIFLLVPVALIMADTIKIIKNRNKFKHAILLVLGLSALGYLAFSSHVSGSHPMQGVIIGSIFYFPVHFVAYCVLKYFLDKKVSG